MERPSPIRTDGTNAFARYSMQVRVPRIARDVLEQNADYPASIRQAVERLAADIESDGPLPPPRPPAPDLVSWATAHAERAHDTWLATEWFHAELAFYRELVRACRFWELGRDPFGPVKEAELAGERLWTRLEEALSTIDGPRPEHASALLEQSLWGNRVDLSYTVAAGRTHREADDLLVDERARAVPFLVRPGARVHIVADNTGPELALDLALADAVLQEARATVTLHVKLQPMFVSDALAADVWRLIHHMRERGGGVERVAARLEEGFAAGRLVLAPDPFWNGPRFLWEAPPHLDAALASASIVVLKGDANYRRLVGDALWPPATPLAQVSSYLRAPVVCLRTMKSDPVVGLGQGLAERLDATQPRWRIDGQRGVLQTYVPEDVG